MACVADVPRIPGLSTDAKLRQLRQSAAVDPLPGRLDEFVRTYLALVHSVARA